MGITNSKIVHISEGNYIAWEFCEEITLGGGRIAAIYRNQLKEIQDNYFELHTIISSIRIDSVPEITRGLVQVNIIPKKNGYDIEVIYTAEDNKK